MTILHLTTFLQGGAGRAITNLAVGQRRAGHQVVVVTSRSGPDGYGNYLDYIAELERAQVPVRLVDSLFARDYLPNLRALEMLRTLVATVGTPAVVHAHAAMPAFVGLLLAGGLRRPLALVQTMHGWGLAKTEAQAETDVRILNLVDRVIVPARPSVARLIALGVTPDRIAVVPYGIDAGEDHILAARDAALVETIRTRRRQSIFVACCVGTVGPRKNQASLVRALETVGDRRAFAVVILGDGDTDALASLVEATGTRDQVHVHGYTPAARQIAREADLVVLPSRSEEQPVALVEAFCDRVLVLASEIPELAALVEDGRTGLRASAENPRALGAALERARTLSTPVREAIIGRARDQYETTFTLPAMIRAYAAEYRTATRQSLAVSLAG